MTCRVCITTAWLKPHKSSIWHVKKTKTKHHANSWILQQVQRSRRGWKGRLQRNPYELVYDQWTADRSFCWKTGSKGTGIQTTVSQSQKPNSWRSPLGWGMGEKRLAFEKIIWLHHMEKLNTNRNQNQTYIGGWATDLHTTARRKWVSVELTHIRPFLWWPQPPWGRLLSSLHRHGGPSLLCPMPFRIAKHEFRSL